MTVKPIQPKYFREEVPNSSTRVGCRGNRGQASGSCQMGPKSVRPRHPSLVHPTRDAGSAALAGRAPTSRSWTTTRLNEPRLVDAPCLRPPRDRPCWSLRAGLRETLGCLQLWERRSGRSRGAEERRKFDLAMIARRTAGGWRVIWRIELAPPLRREAL